MRDILETLFKDNEDLGLSNKIMPKKYKYWNAKKQAKKRSKYKFFSKAGQFVGDQFDSYLPPYLRYMGDLGRWAGYNTDTWRYRRKIYNKKIRTYKVIGSRPYKVGSAPRTKPTPSGVGRYRSFS